jgi:hypothetical protein
MGSGREEGCGTPSVAGNPRRSSDLEGRTLESGGGADVSMSCGSGRVRKLIFALVALDFVPLDAHDPRSKQIRENPPGDRS